VRRLTRRKKDPRRKKDGWFLDSIYIYSPHVSEEPISFRSITIRQGVGEKEATPSETSALKKTIDPLENWVT